MRFGLRYEDLDFIISNLCRFPEIQKAVIFGSRAKGNYKNGSDVDIAILGNNIDFSTVASLHNILEEESPMPYFFDIVDYTHLKHSELKSHIDRVGIVFYDRRENFFI